MPIPVVYSIRSIAVRKGSSAMAVVGIALVVLVLAVLLALAAGFKKSVASAGSPKNIMVMRKGADAELQSQVTREAARIIGELPIVKRDPAGQLMLAAESLTILSQSKRGGGDTNINVRGTPPNGPAIHADVRLAKGRWFTPGTDETVIGAALARRIEGFEVGRDARVGRRKWNIVGIFEADGSTLESEMWIDAEQFQSVYNRGNVFQSVLFRAAGDPEAALNTLKQLTGNTAKKEEAPIPGSSRSKSEGTRELDPDPRLRSLDVKLESEYYAKQSELMAAVISAIAWWLTVIMSIGAITGAMNTMYAAVSQRKREIGCLLALGFSPVSIWMAFILESLALSALGAALGCALSLLFDGMKTGTTNWATFSETAFEFKVTWQILVIASIVALFMGFIGGLLPAVRAARMKVVAALRRA